MFACCLGGTGRVGTAFGAAVFDVVDDVDDDVVVGGGGVYGWPAPAGFTARALDNKSKVLERLEPTLFISARRFATASSAILVKPSG